MGVERIRSEGPLDPHLNFPAFAGEEEPGDSLPCLRFLQTGEGGVAGPSPSAG